MFRRGRAGLNEIDFESLSRIVPPQLSFQLYSSRNFPPVEEQLSTLSRLGYRNVEPFGGLYDDPQAFKSLLDQAELAAPSGHFGLDLLEGDFSRALAIARMIGIGLIVCPWLDPSERASDAAGWRALGKRLGTLARRAQDNGLLFAWHNHDFEFRPLADGSVPIEHLMAEPELLLELDVAWVVRGGADPATWIERYDARIAACHVKDLAPPGANVREDGWADVGTGIVDWRSLWPMIVRAGAKLMIAEHDNPSDFERFARVSLAAMKQYESARR
ncbi:MAG: sugar phosphate isomerase/epimerase family protein [Hyphomicrobiales bacterium]